MKKITCFAVIVMSLMVGCYKSPPTILPRPSNIPRVPVLQYDAIPDSAYIKVVQQFVCLHPYLTLDHEIDYTGYRIAKFKKCWYLRLPFKGRSIANDFIILQTDSLGAVNDGRVVHLEKMAGAPVLDTKTFNGSITIHSVDGANIIQSNISGGFIEAFHPDLFSAEAKTKANVIKPYDNSLSKTPAQTSAQPPHSTNTSSLKTESFPVPYDELPEVVVVAYLPSNNFSSAISINDYLMLQSVFRGGSGSSSGGSGGDNGGGGDGGYGGNGYNNADYGYGIYSPTSNEGEGGANPNYPSAPHEDPSINLQYDESFFRPAIDLEAWFKCFTAIPDAGASCSVTLLGDLPNNTHPAMGMNLWSGNTGHCFLQLTKTGSGQSVTQIIGFTAQSPARAIVNTEAFVPSKLVDNAGHKYNCSLTMPLSADGLNTIMATMRSLADMPYSVVNYDCLDFGLAVVNAVRGTNPLVIDKTLHVNDPFSNVANGPKLYQLLADMVERRSPEMANIFLSGPVWAGRSHGACQ